MKYLFAVASLMAVALPVHSESVYLLIKSARNTKLTGGIALHSIPMESFRSMRGSRCFDCFKPEV